MGIGFQGLVSYVEKYTPLAYAQNYGNKQNKPIQKYVNRYFA